MLDGVNVNKYVGRPSALAGILGYCPQANNFDGNLTVQQQLLFFARLVGIPEQHQTQYVTSTIQRFGLKDFINTQAMNLSGGNKRKLSLAIAMIGQPKIIFIDEASTGVDPASRRTMWKAIRHEGRNSAVILTTHAMEEAEAISSKVAIQVSGFLRSFGTLDQVKRSSGGEISFFVDFDLGIAEIAPKFNISSTEARMHEKRDIEKKLNEWSEDAPRNLGTDKRYVFLNEFKPNGLLDEFYRQMEDGKTINMFNLLHQLLMQEIMANIIVAIETKGIKTKLKKFDGSSFALELSKCEMSFGQIYAFMEFLKAQNSIKEYSCKLTSLEEIFNAHANEAMFMGINKRILRRRTSMTSSISGD